MSAMEQEPPKSQQTQLFAAWGVVALPLAYGLYNTITTALKLFG